MATIFLNASSISPAFSALCPGASLPHPPSAREHLTQVLLWSLCFALVDLAAKSALFSAKPFLPDAAPRWFFIHALANAVTCAFALPDLIAVARWPLCAMASPVLSWIPTYAASAVHLFHLTVYFFELRTEDIVHHLLFGGVLGVMNCAWAWGKVTNHLLFFITGLPGGVTYALLVLVKLGKCVSRAPLQARRPPRPRPPPLHPPPPPYPQIRLKVLREKQWSADLNTWLRTPGLIWFVGVMASCLAHGFYFVPVWAIFLCLALAFVNGTYYGRQ